MIAGVERHGTNSVVMIAMLLYLIYRRTNGYGKRSFAMGWNGLPTEWWDTGDIVTNNSIPRRTCGILAIVISFSRGTSINLYLYLRFGSCLDTFSTLAESHSQRLMAMRTF